MITRLGVIVVWNKHGHGEKLPQILLTRIANADVAVMLPWSCGISHKHNEEFAIKVALNGRLPVCGSILPPLVALDCVVLDGTTDTHEDETDGVGDCGFARRRFLRTLESDAQRPTFTEVWLELADPTLLLAGDCLGDGETDVIDLALAFGQAE